MVMLFCYFFSYYRLLLLFLLFLIYYSHYILSAFYGLIEAIATLFRLWLTILFREYSFLVRCFLSSFLIYSLKVVISNITWFTCIKMYYIYNTPSNYYTSIICFDYTCFESSLSLHYSDFFLCRILAFRILYIVLLQVHITQDSLLPSMFCKYLFFIILSFYSTNIMSYFSLSFILDSYFPLLIYVLLYLSSVTH